MKNIKLAILLSMISSKSRINATKTDRLQIWIVYIAKCKVVTVEKNVDSVYSEKLVALNSKKCIGAKKYRTIDTNMTVIWIQFINNWWFSNIDGNLSFGNGVIPIIINCHFMILNSNISNWLNCVLFDACGLKYNRSAQRQLRYYISSKI